MEMIIKKFNEYSKEELVELFNHWWRYYGKIPYKIEEVERFNKMLDEDSDFVRKCALIAYTGGVGSQDMIKAWRDDSFDKYRQAVENTFSNANFKKYEEELEAEFIEMVVRSYNNPEPDVPLTADQIMEMIENVIGTNIKNYTIITVSPNGFYIDDENKEQGESVLTSDNVHEVYKECMLTDDEITNDMPLVDFVVGEGVTRLGVFNAERLAVNKGKITDMIDHIRGIDNGPSFLSLCVDKNHNLWTGDQMTVDLLVQLGLACEVLEYPLSRDMWSALPGSVPLVIRSHEKDNDDLRSHNSKEFQKVIDEVRKGTYRKMGNAD